MDLRIKLGQTAVVRNWEQDLSSARVRELTKLRARIVCGSGRLELADLQASQLRPGYHSIYLGCQGRKEPCVNCTNVGESVAAAEGDRTAR